MKNDGKHTVSDEEYYASVESCDIIDPAGSADRQVAELLDRIHELQVIQRVIRERIRHYSEQINRINPLTYGRNISRTDAPPCGGSAASDTAVNP